MDRLILGIPRMFNLLIAMKPYMGHARVIYAPTAMSSTLILPIGPTFSLLSVQGAFLTRVKLAHLMKRVNGLLVSHIRIKNYSRMDHALVPTILHIISQPLGTSHIRKRGLFKGLQVNRDSNFQHSKLLFQFDWNRNLTL